LGEGLGFQVNNVFPFSGSTETEVRTGDKGGSVIQFIWA